MTALSATGVHRDGSGLRDAAAQWPASARPEGAGETAPAGVSSSGFLREDRICAAAAWTLAAIAAACVLGPMLLPWSWDEVDTAALVGTGGSGHVLGTDQVGRDVLARLLMAGRISLAVGVTVALATTVIGGALGMWAGYSGGRVDRTITWLLDVLTSIPAVPMLIALAVLVANPNSTMGALVVSIPEWFRIVVVMSVLGWMLTARILRVRAKAVRQLDYVEAARACGAGTPWIIRQHVLPACLPVLLLSFAGGVGSAILGESFLSYLGVGVQPPTPTWGNMVQASSTLTTLRADPGLAVLPSLAITTVVVCANVLGEGVRRAADSLDR